MGQEPLPRSRPKKMSIGVEGAEFHLHTTWNFTSKYTWLDIHQILLLILSYLSLLFLNWGKGHIMKHNLVAHHAEDPFLGFLYFATTHTVLELHYFHCVQEGGKTVSPL